MENFRHQHHRIVRDQRVITLSAQHSMQTPGEELRAGQST